MWKKNDLKSIPGRTAMDQYCDNCKKYLGSNVSGENHIYERGGICPYCGKNVYKEDDKDEKN